MKEKDKYWQVIRGILIIMVILIHVLDISYVSKHIEDFNYYYIIVFRQFINIPVAIFIFLAGYFTKIEKLSNKENIKKYYINKIKHLLIPYLIWSIIYNFLYVIVNYDSVQVFDIIKNFVFGSSSAQLYFILVLLQLVIITPFLAKNIENKKNITICLLITPINLVVIYLYNIIKGSQLPLYSLFFTVWFIFYYLGILVRKNQIKIDKFISKISLKKSIVIVLISFMIAVIESIVLLKLNIDYCFALSQIKIGSYIFVLSMIILLFKIKEYYAENKFNVLRKIGDYSYGIYYVMIYVVIFSYLINKIEIIKNYIFIENILKMVLVLIFSYFSVKITKKFLAKKSELIGF